jgi:hypothetical protein
MKLPIKVIGVLLMSFNAVALPKASDFKEVKVDEQEVSASEEETEKPKLNGHLNDSEEILSGTVRVIRKIGMIEVFFKDLKESYYIPSGGQHSAIFKALDESRKKGTPVSFKANTKSRRVLSLETAPAKSPTTSGTDENSAANSPTSSADGSK